MDTTLTPISRTLLIEDFQLWKATGSYMSSITNLYYRLEGDDIKFRVEVTEAHCNASGSAHGGFLSTLADCWMASNVNLRLPLNARFVTSNLSVDFLCSARPGDILESRITHIKIGKRLCFSYGAILLDGEPIAEIRATFVRLHSSFATEMNQPVNLREPV